jgi:hypothetical protein
VILSVELAPLSSSTYSRANLGSRSLGSIVSGALYPEQTMKISAEVYLEDCGLFDSTLVKS